MWQRHSGQQNGTGTGTHPPPKRINLNTNPTLIAKVNSKWIIKCSSKNLLENNKRKPNDLECGEYIFRKITRIIS